MSTAEVTARFSELRKQAEQGRDRPQFKHMPLITYIRMGCPTITDQQAKRLTMAFAGRCTKSDAALIPLAERALAQLKSAA